MWFYRTLIDRFLLFKMEAELKVIKLFKGGNRVESFNDFLRRVTYL